MKVPSLLLSVGQLSDTVDCGAGAGLTASSERGILSLSVNGTERGYRRGLSFTDEIRTFCSPIPVPSKAGADSEKQFCLRKSHIRRCESPSARSCRLAAGEHFGDGELAIGAVWNHGLTPLKMKLFAIELHRDNVRLERQTVGDAADLGICLRIRPDR
jgi:hypothetical protein